jgi:site-specific DNA recombinase
MNLVRCAIYTRKSSDEGLDQAFNSLDAQREACEAYVQSQRHEGWRVLSAKYDDGGASGGNLERAALTRLMDEIDAGRVDMVVVYKIDRLTRSLADFAKLVERLDKAGASFVSVTQQFNTSTSMGRLTLNVLLSFAQFEREVTAERIRDKIAASKKRGMWMGGLVPLGYDKREDGLVINPDEATVVRTLFQKYMELGCVRRLRDFADSEHLRTKIRILKDGAHKGGAPFSRGRLYHLLSNPIYIGKIRHKTDLHDGQHKAIITDDLWQMVQARLAANASNRKSRTNAASRSPLAGKVFDQDGEPLAPSHAVKTGRRYRYYVSKHLVRDSGVGRKDGWRIPAAELERAVCNALLQDHEVGLLLGDVRNGPSEASPDRLLSAVQSVRISEAKLHIKLDLQNLSAGEPSGPGKAHTIDAAFSLRRRGVETRFVLSGQQAAEPDTVLIQRIVKACSWLDQIKAGASIREVAERDNVMPEYVSNNIDAAFLSPRILKAIMDGRQPPELTATRLFRTSLPLLWADQEQILLP